MKHTPAPFAPSRSEVESLAFLLCNIPEPPQCHPRGGEGAISRASERALDSNELREYRVRGVCTSLFVRAGELLAEPRKTRHYEARSGRLLTIVSVYISREKLPEIFYKIQEIPLSDSKSALKLEANSFRLNFKHERRHRNIFQV